MREKVIKELLEALRESLYQSRQAIIKALFTTAGHHLDQAKYIMSEIKELINHKEVRE